MPTATNDVQSLITNAINGIASISTLPEVTTQIIKTVEDPKSSAQKLHQIVSHDPALVTRVLKVVNSAFYGLPGQVASIERAVVMLGVNAVKNIAVAASLGQLFRGTKLCDGFTAKDLWTHCIAVACAARDLSKQAKLPVVDEAFLAGMIHDIGLLVSLQTWPEKLRLVCEQARASGRNFCEIEREVIGVDHEQLGKALCEKWNFPKSCALVAGNHHQPGKAADGGRVLVTVIAVADAIAASSGQGFTLTRLHDPVDPTVAASVGLTPAVIEATRQRLPELVSAASSLSA
jgi:putative nucleotidyltransferase with HDIG domain